LEAQLDTKIDEAAVEADSTGAGTKESDKKRTGKPHVKWSASLIEVLS
jgi:hypothetical protein